jgi:membrane-bound lytic murein transglycosylase MltF
MIIAAVSITVALGAFGQPTIPPEAWTYRDELARSAFRVFGPRAPIADLAAQIHQESNWRNKARSAAGALGLAQFMPLTAELMAKSYDVCRPANPFSATWAFRCRDLYMRDQLAAIKPMVRPKLSECDSWAFAFRAYNGGRGWLTKDRRMAYLNGADPDDWLEVQPFNSGRTLAAWRENTQYPPKIFTLAKLYEQEGWGRRICST